MPNNTSQHILSTSANLLGFCLFVITSLHISDYAAKSVVDEFVSGIALLLISSCVFSFFSIRSEQERTGRRLERVADYLFILALFGVFIIVLLIASGLMK